jgi:hypothetical protein
LNRAIDACASAGIGLIGMKTQSSVPAGAATVRRWMDAGFSLHQARLRAAVDDERLSACLSGLNRVEIVNENVRAVADAKGLRA